MEVQSTQTPKNSQIVRAQDLHPLGQGCEERKVGTGASQAVGIGYRDSKPLKVRRAQERGVPQVSLVSGHSLMLEDVCVSVMMASNLPLTSVPPHHTPH